MNLAELCPVVLSRLCWQSSFTFLCHVQSNSVSFIANSFQAAGCNAVISIVPCTSAGKEAPGDWTNIPSVGASCKPVDRSREEGASFNQTLQPNALWNLATVGGRRPPGWEVRPSGVNHAGGCDGEVPLHCTKRNLAKACGWLRSSTRGSSQRHTWQISALSYKAGAGSRLCQLSTQSSWDGEEERSSQGEAAPATHGGSGGVDSKHGMGCLTTPRRDEGEADANHPQTQPSCPKAVWL